MFRSEFDDAVLPYLVSDELAYAYIDEAQKMFCRKTEGIEDGRSFQLAIVPATEWYDLDKKILKLRKATDAATGRPVTMVNQERAEQNGIRFDGRTGPLRALVLGIEKGAARAWPMPDTSATVTLEVFRLPATVVEHDEFEIDEQHHQPLLMWVKHRAYGIKDSEVYDKRASEENLTNFERYCAAARIEQERARRVVGTVSYGGL